LTNTNWETEKAALLVEIADLTKALTGLTCGGSEFFSRKGDRFVADIPACVNWVNQRNRDAHNRLLDAVYKRLEVEDKLTKYTTQGYVK